ncbi:MAG: hypothetical protein HOP19_01330, partial [Acidobacteria bacterium]|nr:hypothetical protein [Acidobacteriota bacterium]
MLKTLTRLARRSALAQSVCLGLLTLAAVLVWQALTQHELKEIMAAQSPGHEIERHLETRAGLGQESGGNQREEWFYQQRAYPLEDIPRNAMLEANTQADVLDKLNVDRRPTRLNAAQQNVTTNWRALGPQPIR